MFVLGHVGIGRTLVRRWSEQLPLLPLTIGMLLPDLIDKPLYYARLWPYVTSTRTFGHTGLLLLTLAAVGVLRQSRTAKALALGSATHLLLDTVSDLPRGLSDSSTLMAVIWPLDHGQFYTYYVPSMAAHAALLLAWPTLTGEVIGAALLLLAWRRSREAAAIRVPGRPSRS